MAFILWPAETEAAVIQTLSTVLTVLAVVFVFVPIAAASSKLPSVLNNLQVSIPKSVLNEKDNKGCFRNIHPSSYVVEHEESSVGQCFPGYHRQKEGEECHGRYGCCVCEHGTYQPHDNNCSYCIQKTFCPDYGLEFKDFGSPTNNSKCRNKTAGDLSAYTQVGANESLTTTEFEDSTAVTEATFQIKGEDVSTEESVITYMSSIFDIIAKRLDFLVFIFVVVLFSAGVLVSLPLLICWVIAWTRGHTLKTFILKLCFLIFVAFVALVAILFLAIACPLCPLCWCRVTCYSIFQRTFPHV